MRELGKIHKQQEAELGFTQDPLHAVSILPRNSQLPGPADTPT